MPVCDEIMYVANICLLIFLRGFGNIHTIGVDPKLSENTFLDFWKAFDSRINTST